MRAQEQEQTGGAGISEVSAKFQRIGWGPVPNGAHDLGTDLLVQARDRRRFDRGLIVGVQVKAGASWFEDEVRDEQGRLSGWWYYEPDKSHFEDWVTHGLPHLLVFHDLDQNVSYWVHVTAERVVGTGKGCKIVVPRTKTIDNDHVDELLKVAAKQKAAPRLEGTSFGASANLVSPGRRMRYALLAPRLVAPHRNAGYESVVQPEEALALCTQGRFVDLERFSEKHGSVPDLHQPYSGHDWRWSFVRAFWTWVAEDDLEALARALDAAPDVEGRAAAGVLLACALLRAERPQDALALLDRLVSNDELTPIDHGWALVQRARLRAESGDVAGARADAVDAQRQFAGEADDVTVSALAAAAAWLLFTTAGFAAGDLSSTLTASDTAIGWWRSQTISWALREASERAFRAWSQDTTNRWSAEDAEALNLFAAELNADLTGEHGAWRSVAALSARQMLMRAHAAGDEPGMAAAVTALRRSGDNPSLKLALAYLRRLGPVHALAEALRAIGDESWTHTTAQTNLEALAIAGDLADEAMADAWIEMLVDALIDPTEFSTRVRPSFMVNLAATEAINGLLPAASGAARLRVAEFLASQNGPVDDVVATVLTGWITQFGPEELNARVRTGLRRLAAVDRGRVGATVLGVLADHDDADAKREVHERALAGDLNALSAMGAVTVLTPDQAETLIERFESMVRHVVERAEKSTWGFGAFDASRGLALFNIWFPEVARWEPLLALLTHRAVASNDKRDALELIVDGYERVPEEVRERLAAELDAVAAATAVDVVGGRSLGALATAVGIVTGAIANESADVAVAQLALGTEQDRCDAAALLGRGWCERMRPLLASFVADGRVSVRRGAAQAVGRLAASTPNPVVVELARYLALDRGAIVPPALLVGLGRGDVATELGREVAAGLRNHPSARVRRLSRDFLTRYE